MRSRQSAALWLSLLTAVSVFAAGAGPQTRPAKPAAREDVRAIVRAVEARYRSARTLKATFLERYAEGRNDIRVETGTVYFSRPGRMRWEYEAPETKFFLSDGKTVWFYVPADRTVTRAKLRESADFRTPLALLTGKAQLSRFCGRVELADVRASATGNLVLRCLPRIRERGSGDSRLAEVPPFQEALLEVDAAYRLVRVLVREPGEIETEFRFANWEENIRVGEVLFHFQAPPGVAIVDEASLSGPVR